MSSRMKAGQLWLTALFAASCTISERGSDTPPPRSDFELSDIHAERWENDAKPLEVFATTANAARADGRVSLTHPKAILHRQGTLVVTAKKGIIDPDQKQTILRGDVRATTSSSVTLESDEATHDWTEETIQLSA